MSIVLKGTLKLNIKKNTHTTQELQIMNVEKMPSRCWNKQKKCNRFPENLTEFPFSASWLQVVCQLKEIPCRKSMANFSCTQKLQLEVIHNLLQILRAARRYSLKMQGYFCQMQKLLHTKCINSTLIIQQFGCQSKWEVPFLSLW